MPVHHTDEIAETYAAYGKQLAKVWMHCNFITIDGEKISKSLGNVILVPELVERGYSPMDYKMWVLSGHYQGERNFTFEALEGARNRRNAWRERIALCYQDEVKSDDEAYSRVLDAVSNNLNSAEAFSIIDNVSLGFEDWRKIDELFGLKLIADTPVIADEVRALISERDGARAARDFARSDEIRDDLAAKGIGLRDTVDGAKWYYL